MKSFGWLVRSSFTILLVAMSSSWAQAEAPAPPLDCENDRSVGACVGEILDVELEMINGLEGMMVDIQAMGLFSFGQAQSSVAAAAPAMDEDLFAKIESLKRQHGRAREALDASTDDEFNEMIEHGDKERGKKCKPTDTPFFDSLRDTNGDVDLTSIGLQSAGSKFGNGKCDIFSAVDLAGNDVKVHEKKENMCETVCEEKVVGGERQTGKSKDRLAGNLVEALRAARGANQLLTAQRAQVSQLGLVLAGLRSSESGPTLTAGPSDPCAPGTPGPGGDLIAAQVLNFVIVGLDVLILVEDLVAEVLGTAKDVAKQLGNQTVAGFNASSAVIPFTVAFHIAKGIKVVTAGIKSGVGSAKGIITLQAKIDGASKTDKTKACAKIIRDDTVSMQVDVDILKVSVADLQVKAGETNDALATIQDELAVLMSLLETNRDLLLTPPGRRVGFPRP